MRASDYGSEGRGFESLPARFPDQAFDLRLCCGRAVVAVIVGPSMLTRCSRLGVAAVGRVVWRPEDERSDLLGGVLLHAVQDVGVGVGVKAAEW